MKSCSQDDDLALIIHLVDGAFKDEVIMEMVEEVLVKSCSVVSPHCNFMTGDADDSDGKLNEYNE